MGSAPANGSRLCREDPGTVSAWQRCLKNGALLAGWAAWTAMTKFRVWAST